MNDVGKVLLLEDNGTTRLIVSNALQMKNIEVVTTSSLAEAESYIKDASIRLFLLDIHLPDGTSEKMVSRLRAIRPMIPILIITAEYDSDVMAGFFSSGVKDFIHKPINPLLLYHKVKSCLEWAETEQALYKANESYLRIMSEKEQEEALAFFVYDHILHTNSCSFYGVDVATISSGRFCGDILIPARSPNGNLIIMLGDATGHGMAAAITIYPLVVTFNAMVAKGFSSASILYELNEKHSQTVPSNRFFACIFIEVSFSENTIRIWNGGMPHVLIFDKEKKLIEKVVSKNMAIGILPSNEMSTKFETYSLDNIAYVNFFTDGLIENKWHDNRIISFEEAYSILSDCPTAPEYSITKMRSMELDDNNSDDDMTLCCLNIDTLKKELDERAILEEPPQGNFIFHFDISGKAALSEQYPLKLIDLLEEYGFSQHFRQRVFTILSELIVNSVDHGILKISSSLKQNDFIAYLNSKHEAAQHINNEQKISIELSWNAVEKSLYIKVSDSGKGYQFNSEHPQQLNQTYGRGLSMVHALSDDVLYDQHTNTTHATLRY